MANAQEPHVRYILVIFGVVQGITRYLFDRHTSSRREMRNGQRLRLGALLQFGTTSAHPWLVVLYPIQRISCRATLHIIALSQIYVYLYDFDVCAGRPSDPAQIVLLTLAINYVSEVRKEHSSSEIANPVFPKLQCLSGVLEGPVSVFTCTPPFHR